MPLARASTCRRYCHRLVNFDIPFNPSRLEQRIGRVDRYGQKRDVEISHFVPDVGSTTYAGDASFMARIAQKVANVEYDLGSVNQVIGDDIQKHFTGRVNTRKARGQDGNAAINKTLAGSVTLNARLTELERGYDESRVALHLEPGNLRRVVDAALKMTHQPLLIPTEDPDIGFDRPEAEAFEVPPLSQGWQECNDRARHPTQSRHPATNHF